MYDNICDKLKALGMNAENTRTITRDIFGEKIGQAKLKGLVDSLSEEEFDLELEKKISEWNKFTNGPKFVKYFLDYKAANIKNCMTAELRTMVGLGFPPKPYTQNANESVNAAIKNDLKAEFRSGRRMRLKVEDFIQKMRGIINQQEDNMKKALVNRGPYRLKPEYAFLAIDELSYWRKNEAQRKAVFKK